MERRDRETCPHCGGNEVWRHGTFIRKDGTRGQRYRCRSCGRSFNPSTGTVFAYIKKREPWTEALRSMSSGSVTLRQLASHLGVHPSTAFRWRHRVLAALSALPKPVLRGFVSIGEYHIPYSEKGSRTPRGRGGGDTWWQVGPDGPSQAPLAARPDRPAIFRSVSHGRGSCVLVAQSETGHIITIAGPGRLKPPALQECLKRMVATGKVSSTGAEQGAKPMDEPSGAAEDAITEIFAFGHPYYYPEACRQLGLAYRSGWEERKRSDFTEAIARERSYDRVRAGIRGWLLPFLGVATRYLHHYLAWYDAVLRTDDLRTLIAKVRIVDLMLA